MEQERVCSAGGKCWGQVLGGGDVLAALNECRQQTIESVVPKRATWVRRGMGGQVGRREENRRNTLSRSRRLGYLSITLQRQCRGYCQ